MVLISTNYNVFFLVFLHQMLSGCFSTLEFALNVLWSYTINSITVYNYNLNKDSTLHCKLCVFAVFLVTNIKTRD